MAEIGFYCEHAFALYDIYPIVQKYRENNNIIIITYRRYANITDKYLSPNKIIFIEDYVNKYVSLINRWFFLLSVRDDFSEFYSQRKSIRFNKRELLFERIFSFAKIDNEKINKKYTKLFSIFFKLRLIKPFDTQFEKIFVFTKVFNQYLLIPHQKESILITESWDHPAKEPFLINPKVAFTWNKDLKKELKHYQNYDFVSVMFPLKFRYIFEYNAIIPSKLLGKLSEKYILDLDLIDDNTFVYPMCTSSDYFAFDGEVLFLRNLATLLIEKGYSLYIRPYPLAPSKDVEALSKIPNIKIGIANNIKLGNEVFDEEHLIHKYLVIYKSLGIINIGTTFVFDAALLDKEKIIIQLIVDNPQLGDFNNYSKGVHIKKYLHNEYSISFKDMKENNFSKEYMNVNFRNKIKSWVLNE